MGSLATGTGVVNIFIGIGIVVIGLFHIILAFKFKNTLDQSEFKKHRLKQQAEKQQQQQEEQQQQPPTAARNYNQELQQAAVNAAWDNRQQIAQTAYDNRGFIQDNASTVGTVVANNQAQYY